MKKYSPIIKWLVSDDEQGLNESVVHISIGFSWDVPQAYYGKWFRVIHQWTDELGNEVGSGKITNDPLAKRFNVLPIKP